MPGLLGALDDEDGEFSELRDAEIHRVDLVDKAANGTRFLIAKAAGGGLMPADTIHSLLKAQGGPMPAMTGRKRTYKIVKGKNGKPQVAVYDEAGKLIGLVDPDDITEVQTAGSDADKNAARVQAQAAAGQQQQAAEDVTKAVVDALAGLKPRPSSVLKKSWAGVTVKDAFTELTKSLDSSHEARIKAAVSHQSMKLMVGFGMAPQAAISQVKKAAVMVARQQGLI